MVKGMGMPQATVTEVPVTKADRAAMQHKHPVETPPMEVGRTQIGPGEFIVSQWQGLEIYRHESNGVVKIYNVREIKDAIHQDDIPVVCLVIDLNEEYVDHIFAYGGCEQDHIDQITVKDIRRPAVGVLYEDGLQIIDGSHRIVARWRRFGKRDVRLLCVPGDVVDAAYLLPQHGLTPIPR